MSSKSEIQTSPIAFKADDGTVLRGWIYRPAVPEGIKSPVVLLHHGFSAVKESFLVDYAQVFAEAGFIVLGYDPRGLGESGGRVPLEIDPMFQVSDFRDAITFALGLPGVDATKVGVWGSSYGGGVAIQAAALDKRIACVAVQVPFLSGGNIWSHIPPEAQQQLSALFAHERAARATGQPVQLIPVVTANPERGELCVLGTRESYEWSMEKAAKAPNWRNEVTLRSLELTFSFEPASYIHQVAPRPLLIVGAEGDTLMPIEGTRAVFDRAGEPKRFVTIPCGHFGPYDDCFEQSSGAARDWFVEHLK
jgi:fermentation-respiration switch protein FrsA (DUF1100 family)